MQKLELTLEEAEVLKEVLQHGLTEVDVEVFRTDTRDFKEMLKHRRDLLDALQKVPAVLQHFFEITCIGPEHFNIDFGQAMLKYFFQDFRLFKSEFELLHSILRLNGTKPLKQYTTD